MSKVSPTIFAAAASAAATSSSPNQSLDDDLDDVLFDESPDLDNSATESRKGRDGPLSQLADSIKSTSNRIVPPLNNLQGGSWTSDIARRAAYVAYFIMIGSLVAFAYILATADWNGIGNLPFKAVVPLLATMFTFPLMFGVVGLFLLLVSHGVEYLARVSQNIAAG